MTTSVVLSVFYRKFEEFSENFFVSTIFTELNFLISSSLVETVVARKEEKIVADVSLLVGADVLLGTEVEIPLVSKAKNFIERDYCSIHSCA